MKGDKEYFDNYFCISELLIEKDLLVDKLWEGKNDTGYLASAHYQARSAINTLNSLILDEEKRLSRIISQAESQGTVFSFESFARRLDLSGFEKRLMLFFLHLDLFCSGSVGFPRRKLALILDCEETPMSRAKTLLDLFPGSILYKKGILSEIDVGDSEVRLAERMRDALRKLMSGQETDLPVPEEIGEEVENAGVIYAPEYGMEDVFLPGQVKEQVLLHLNTHGRLSDLGVMDKVRRGRGLCMLFYGPPGTGKSMLSHAVARHLGKKVLQASTAQIKSHWVGRTDKNIAALFKTAKDKNYVLCLDEVDSLLFERSEASRSWEISQANTFLEEVERFDGVLVMTTNLEGRLDPAIERRVALRVRFDAPDNCMRETIWQNQIPSTVKRGEDINWACLGMQYSFTGGYIKNAVMSALRHMLSRESQVLEMKDLVFGAESEKKGLLRNSTKAPMGFAARG